MNVVIATCLERPALTESDQYFAHALEERNVNVNSAPWNGSFAVFAGADAVVIRSTWDYFELVEDFYTWIERLENTSATIENNPSILKWNARKNYLFELQAKGIHIIPTFAVTDSVEDIQKTAKENNWKKVVLKCLVSGTARGLSLVDADNTIAIQEALHKAKPLAKYGLMLQPFCEEIVSSGELSLIFIAGNFSHAVRKRPKQGDFRIQADFGGQYTSISPDRAIIEDAIHCLSKVPGFTTSPPLYARVDGIMRDHSFALMELELTEPELMFPLAPEAASHMARALLKRLA